MKLGNLLITLGLTATLTACAGRHQGDETHAGTDRSKDAAWAVNGDLDNNIDTHGSPRAADWTQSEFEVLDDDATISGGTSTAPTSATETTTNTAADPQTAPPPAIGTTDTTATTDTGTHMKKKTHRKMKKDSSKSGTTMESDVEYDSDIRSDTTDTP